MSMQVASSSALLSTLPSVVQALLVLALLVVVTAREVLRHDDRGHPAASKFHRAGRVLIPLVLLVLGIRLLVILQ